MTDIVWLLRNKINVRDLDKAADTIEALRAENARLLEALTRLVDVAQYCDGINTSEQLCAARAALGDTK